MALTASDVQSQSFGTSRHGYNPQEVDVFLEQVATEVDNFHRAIEEARSRISAAETRARAAEQQAAQAMQAAQTAQAAQAAKGSSEAVATEKQIAQAFIAAQRSADELREEARKESEIVYRDAEARARDIVRDALAEKQRILEEIDRLRASTEAFRSEYLALLNHFTADAKKSLPTLDTVTPDTAADRQSTREATERFQSSEQPARESSAAAPTPQPSAASDLAASNQQEPVSKTSTLQEAFSDPTVAIASADDLDDDLDIEEID